MDFITKNPGLQHISEDIFKLLDIKTLASCRSVSSSWKKVLNPPMFWLKKMKSKRMSSHIERSWKILVEEAIEADLVSNQLALTMTKVCNNSEKKLQTFEVIVKLAQEKMYPDLIRFMLENENPNSKIEENIIEMPSCLNVRNQLTFLTMMENIQPIHLAALFGFSGAIGKLTKNYNYDPIIKETWFGRHPIHLAAMNGHLDTVKYLVNFTEKPIMPDSRIGLTPIHLAARNGHLYVVKFLVNLTDTPISTDHFGHTPIYEAACWGHLNVVKFLVDFTDIPNAPNASGDTPIQVAKKRGRVKVKEFLEEYCNEKEQKTENYRQ